MTPTQPTRSLPRGSRARSSGPHRSLQAASRRPRTAAPESTGRPQSARAWLVGLLDALGDACKQRARQLDPARGGRSRATPARRAARAASAPTPALDGLDWLLGVEGLEAAIASTLEPARGAPTEPAEEASASNAPGPVDYFPAYLPASFYQAPARR